MKLTKVYQDADEKYLSAVVLYAKDESDGFVYADSAHTVTVDRETLLGLCMKNLALVHYKGVYHRPVFFKDDNSTVTMTIATAVAAGASAALELKSKEPVQA